jgi:uncharacterized protein (TIGR02145 family)
MKKIFTCLAIISIALSALAQPQKMSYQCVIRNSSGVLVTNHSVGIRISILQGTTTGTVVYQEIYNPDPQTNTNGLLSIEIGSGLAITGTFSEIDWASGPYYLKTETDPAGGTNYTIVGTSQLLSVPYAMYAKTAGNAFSGNDFDLTNKPILFSGNYNDLTNRPAVFNGLWENITEKPTTLTGYGITDGMSTSHAANGITSNLISNWNTAFSWGNHAGLYKPISYFPTWGEISGKPTTLDGYGITDAVNTTGNQTIAGNKTFSGIINASSQNITNVANPVNVQDVATKGYVDVLQTQVTMLKNTLMAGGFVTDIDGNIYNTVKIGNQIWMAENLKTTKFNDGTPIPQVTDSTAWSNLTTPGYCWNNNDESGYKNVYGALYNEYVTGTIGKNVCPVGWNLPDGRTDWKTLILTIDPESIIMDPIYMNLVYSIIAAKKLKEAGTKHWLSPNDANNETGFTGLPAGMRTRNGSFIEVGSNGFWWSGFTTSVSVFNLTNYVYCNIDVSFQDGFSIRCIKD